MKFSTCEPDLGNANVGMCIRGALRHLFYCSVADREHHFLPRKITLVVVGG